MMLNLMAELINAQRFGGSEEKKPKARGLEETKKETDGDNTSCSSSMMLDGEVMLGPETAFLAEGSVHDTGGMVEWAGTVGRDGGNVVALSSSFFILSPCFCLLFYFPLQWLSNDHPNISAWAVPACGGKQLGGV